MTKERLFKDFPPVSTETWEEVIHKDLKGADYDKKLIWKTIEGIDLKPYYRKEDLEKLEYLEGTPGEYPFHRGNENNNEWEIHQEIFAADLALANETALNNICNGLNSVGFDSSKINTNTDFDTVVKNIDIEKVSICFRNASCFRNLTRLVSYFIEKNSIDSKTFTGSYDADPFENFILNGSFPEDQDKFFEVFKELIELVEKHLPAYKAVCIKGTNFHNSGVHIVQEVAFTLAAATEFLVQMKEKGLEIEKVLPHIQLNLSVGSNYFLEIAKIRAIRLLWAKIVKEFGIDDTEKARVKVHSNTSIWNKSVYDPHTNMLRLTTEAMSAILGGADSINVDPFDYIYKKPTEFSLRNARNIQNLLKEESYLNKVADPGAGSYYIENITDAIAKEAWELFKTVETKGGFISAFKNGFIQNEIDKTIEARNKLIKTKKENVLGASLYPNTDEEIIENINPEILDEKEIPEGEIKPLKPYRKALPFERLRIKTEKHVEAGNKKPVIFLLPIGKPAMASARQIFSTNFFGVAGFKIVSNARFKDIESGIEAAKQKQADLVVLCSSDEEYLDLAKEANKLLDKNTKMVVAGNPVDIIEELKNNGVHGFIHIKTPLVETLSDYQNLLNIK